MTKKFENDPFKRTYTSLEDLVDSINDTFQCPVTIEDANHRLLAYNSHEDETDPARISTIIKRRVPEKVINKLWKEGIIPQLMATDDPIRIPEIKEIGLRDRVAVSIRKNNKVLGYIWIVEEKNKLSDKQLLQLKNAASAATTLLIKLHLQKKKKEEDYQDFFWQLITGHYKSQEEISKKFYQLNISMPERFSVLVFQFEQEISRQMEDHIAYLISTSQKITNHFLVVMRNELILIASPHPSYPDEKNFREFITFFIAEMKNRFSVEGIKGSSGTVYADLERVETSYQEALKVLEMKDEYPEVLEDVYHYHQLGMFRYFDAIMKEKRSDSYEHPAIFKLEQYDKVNNTNFLKTLEVFINEDSNMNDASKKLFVHINTLNYRMKRIVEITEIDLKNVNEKMSIYVDLMLRRKRKDL
ncbi:PucR family transcriptional regulator [Sutcliffiella cohnii]